MLVESSGYLGGIAATGIPIQGFHGHGDRMLVGGISWEIIQKVIDDGASPGPGSLMGSRERPGKWAAIPLLCRCVCITGVIDCV